jgi:hypothetical protein
MGGLENKVLRQTFRTKTVEGAGKWRKFHNEEFKSFTSSPHIIVKNK